MDEITQNAFKKLWSIWQNYQDMGDDPDEWKRLLEHIEEICSQSQDATDPEFIKEFAYDVLKSMDRITAPKA